MAGRDKQFFEDFDDPGFLLDPSFDHDLLGDAADESFDRVGYGLTARQCIERRNEAQWLRNQTVDWDDWDEYFEVH